MAPAVGFEPTTKRLTAARLRSWYCADSVTDPVTTRTQTLPFSSPRGTRASECQAARRRRPVDPGRSSVSTVSQSRQGWVATPEGAQASDLRWLQTGAGSWLNYTTVRRVVELPVGRQKVAVG